MKPFIRNTFLKVLLPGLMGVGFAMLVLAYRGDDSTAAAEAYQSLISSRQPRTGDVDLDRSREWLWSYRVDGISALLHPDHAEKGLVALDALAAKNPREFLKVASQLPVRQIPGLRVAFHTAINKLWSTDKATAYQAIDSEVFQASARQICLEVFSEVAAKADPVYALSLDLPISSKILKDWASLDPKSAVAWVQSKDDRPIEWEPVIQGWAKVSFKDAYEFIDTLPPSPERVRALESLFRLDHTDFHSVSVAADQLTNTGLRIQAKRELISQWVREDPKAVTKWIEASDDPGERRLLEAELNSALVYQDPGRIFELVDAQRSNASRLTTLSNYTASRAYRLGFDDTVKWIGTLKGHAREHQGALLAVTLKEWVQRAPTDAVRHIESMESGSYEEFAVPLWSSALSLYGHLNSKDAEALTEQLKKAPQATRDAIEHVGNDYSEEILEILKR